MTERNPIFIPEPVKKKSGCPYCEHHDYLGRNIQGMVVFTCRKCKKQWQGGLPQIPIDPKIPQPTTLPPTVDFVAIKNSRGETIGAEEIRRKIDLTTDFRRGTLIPEEGEEDV